jgi:hypothetical protein
MHDDDPIPSEMIKVRVPADPEYQETFGASAECVWAEPTDEPGVYRIDNIPMFTEAVRLDDLVRVSPAAHPRGGDVHDFEEVVKFAGHTTFHVFVTDCDPGLDPGDDPLVAPLWRAWPRLEALGCTYAGGGDRGVYLLAIDAPPGTDLDAVRAVLDEGEAAEHWAWAGGSTRDTDDA